MLLLYGAIGRDYSVERTGLADNQGKLVSIAVPLIILIVLVIERFNLNLNIFHLKKYKYSTKNTNQRANEDKNRLRYKTIHSGRAEYPEAKDVFLVLLNNLSTHHRGWVHFECKKYIGIRNIVHFNPFIEVALKQDDRFELNLGFPERTKDIRASLLALDLEFPDYWRVKKKRIFVPSTELEFLSNWIYIYFLKVYNCPENFKVSGWING